VILPLFILFPKAKATKLSAISSSAYTGIAESR
jgi:hypothetical protein